MGFVTCTGGCISTSPSHFFCSPAVSATPLPAETLQLTDQVLKRCQDYYKVGCTQTTEPLAIFEATFLPHTRLTMTLSQATQYLESGNYTHYTKELISNTGRTNHVPILQFQNTTIPRKWELYTTCIQPLWDAWTHLSYTSKFPVLPKAVSLYHLTPPPVQSGFF